MSGGIIHCFSYSKEIAAEYLKMGLYLGIGGVLTFKKCQKKKEVAAMAPTFPNCSGNRLSLHVPRTPPRQTQLLPQPPYVAAALAEIKGITPEEVIAVTEENAKKLLFK